MSAMIADLGETGVWFRIAIKKFWNFTTTPGDAGRCLSSLSWKPAKRVDHGPTAMPLGGKKLAGSLDGLLAIWNTVFGGTKSLFWSDSSWWRWP